MRQFPLHQPPVSLRLCVKCVFPSCRDDDIQDIHKVAWGRNEKGRRAYHFLSVLAQAGRVCVTAEPTCYLPLYPQEIQALAGCKCKNITEYYASVLRPNSAELHIIMELMACSVSDLVGAVP
jgi:hypothetical protein